ncbi:MarR family winged helix-turn-helix transcriptional regulator [Longispora urticae]
MVRPTDDQARLAASLRQSIMRLNRSLRRARPISELTPSQLSALTSLDLAGALTPRELADTERVQPPTMTKVIAKLEERGLVQRTPHPTDGRQVILATTETARSLLGDNQRARDAWLAERLAELTAEEREALSKAAELLERIARS